MYEAIALHNSAKRILDATWCTRPGQFSVTARRWLKGPEGEQALIRYMEQMNGARSDAASLLAIEIFSTEAEIASRKAGWRIELEASPHAPETV